MTATIDSLTSVDWSVLTEAELLAQVESLEQAGRLIDTARALAAAEIDDRSRFILGRDGLAQRLGHARGSHLMEQLTRVPQAEAARRIRLGSVIRPRRGLCGDVLPPE